MQGGKEIRRQKNTWKTDMEEGMLPEASSYSWVKMEIEALDRTG